MEFFSEIYCTWPSLVKQNTANANSLYTMTMNMVVSMKMFAPLGRSAPGAQVG